MPRNGSGTMSVPNTFTPSTTISSSEINANFSDIATEITGSLPRDGQAAMTAPLKIADGSAAAPGLAFDTDTNTGLYRISADKIGVSVGGAKVAEFGSTGVADSAGNLITSGSLSIPQGRLTLSTGVAVMTSTVSGATTIYYTPHTGRRVPIYDGTNWAMTDIEAELSQTLADDTKSPAAATTNSNYDLFVWSDSGTIRCTRGPAWTSATARGTGPSTTELEYVDGLLVNKIAITNGPAAQRGTYVGTVRTDASTQVNFIVPNAAALGGTAGVVGIWNAYNRKQWISLSADTTNTWSYTTTTWRQSNASAGMQTSFLSGLVEDLIWVQNTSLGSGTADNGRIAIGYDVTNAYSGIAVVADGNSVSSSTTATLIRPVELGWHYVAAIEYGGTSMVFRGDANDPGSLQSGLYAMGWY